jgi:hypothetical protein
MNLVARCVPLLFDDLVRRFYPALLFNDFIQP